MATQLGPRRVIALLLGAVCVVSVTALGPADASVASTAPSALTVTTSVPVRTARVFTSAAAAYGTRHSRSVRNLQTMLIRKKYATAGLRRSGATGSYLSQTRASVARLQVRLGYTGANADGIIGPTTAARLGLTWVAASASAPTQVVQTVPASGLYPINPLPPSVAVPPLSATQLKTVLEQAGFVEPAIRVAWAIAMRESRGYPAVVGPANSNGTHDYGLFQFNDVHRATTDFTRIYDPIYNAQAAFRVSNGGLDFGAWAIGDTGWAGQLHKSAPEVWTRLQNEMLAWRVKYPAP